MTPEEQMAMIQQMLVMSGYLQPSMPGTGIVPGGDGGNVSTDENRSLSFARNFNNYIADPITGAFAGPQAFSAQAFAPVQTREEVELPGQNLLRQYAQMRPGTVEHIIAMEALNGGSASSAFAEINRILNGEPKDEAALAAQQALRESVLPRYDFDLGEPVPGQFDMESVWNQTQDFFKQLGSDPVYDDADYVDVNGVQIPVRGYRVVEEDSPLTQKFRELGLPTPFEQYQREDFMQPWQIEQMQRADTDFAEQSAMAQAAQSQAIANQAEQRAMLERLIRQRDSRAEGVADRAMSGERRLTGLEGVLGKAAKAAEGPVGAIGRGLSAITPGGASVFSVFGDAADRSDEPAVEEPERENAFSSWLMDKYIRPGIRDRMVSQARSRDPMQRKIIEMQRQQTMRPSPVNRAGQAHYDAYKKWFYGNKQASQAQQDAAIQARLAQIQGRTPLADVLMGRRAQGTAAGIPQRNFSWMG